MTAINPARLKIQTAALSEFYRRPVQFSRDLHKLLSFYADRVRRPGQSGHPPPAVPAYQVPRPVITQILQELKPLLEKEPSRGLLLADHLWEEGWLETRILAAALLGLIPPINPGPLLKRIRQWARENGERSVLEVLIHHGLRGLYSSCPERVEELIAGFSARETPGETRAALAGLAMLVDQPAYDNLPFVFNELELILQRKQGPQRELIALLKKLILESEQEALFFLLRQITPEPGEEIQRIVRRCLPVFSEESRNQLRERLRRNR